MNEIHSINSVRHAATWQEAVAQPRAFGRADHLQYGAIIVLAAVTLSIARYLHPAERGFGTHEQLGLPPCTFLLWTGLPCPSCGLTTSFAHAAHLQFLASFLAQPFGFLAFWLTALSIPFALYLLYRRVTWDRILHARAANPVVYVLLVLYLLSWVYKIIVMT